jgi:excisionase family DNA binding protein
MQNLNSQLPATVRVNWWVKDFCASFGIGRSTFYQKVLRGELNIIKVGTRTLVPDTEARAWMERKARNL